MTRRGTIVRKTIYIAGPMTGLPDENFPAFYDAERRLNLAGYATLNPANNGHSDGTRKRPWFMRRDIPMVMKSDGIALLPGWQDSVGARLEHHIAQVLELEILDAVTLQPLVATP